jgi:hypothetical protein
VLRLWSCGILWAWGRQELISGVKQRVACRQESARHSFRRTGRREHRTRQWKRQAGMGKVFVSIALSLDGYMAPEGMTMGKPEHRNWGAKWGALMAWIFNQHA